MFLAFLEFLLTHLCHTGSSCMRAHLTVCVLSVSQGLPSGVAVVPTLLILTPDTCYYLRADSRDLQATWKFAFQSSIAFLIDKILKVCYVTACFSLLAVLGSLGGVSQAMSWACCLVVPVMAVSASPRF